MATAPMPEWHGFTTLRVSARWTGEEGSPDPIWELFPIRMTSSAGRRAFAIQARLIVLEDAHEVATQLAITARDSKETPLPSLDDTEQDEVAMRVNRLLWERSTVVAKAAAGLVGVSLSPLLLPPKPELIRLPEDGHEPDA